MKHSPFGTILDGRTFSSGSYRYGFGGQEKDDEAKGGGNSYDFGARIYDPRLGRWLSPDPKWKLLQMVSPYAYAKGDPINKVDIAGEVIAGANQASFERLQGHVNTVFAGKDNAALRGLFKQQENALSFQSISKDEFIAAVKNIQDPDVRALANAYYEAVNSTVTYKLLLVHDNKKINEEPGFENLSSKKVIGEAVGEETGGGDIMTSLSGGAAIADESGKEVAILFNESASTNKMLNKVAGIGTTKRNADAGITRGLLTSLFRYDPFIKNGGDMGPKAIKTQNDAYLQDALENITNRILNMDETSENFNPTLEQKQKSTSIPGEIDLHIYTSSPRDLDAKPHEVKPQKTDK